MYESDTYSSRSYSSNSTVNSNLGCVTHVWCTHIYHDGQLRNTYKAVTASHIEEDH